MATTVSDRWNGLKNWFALLPVYLRRLHRILGVVWLLSLALTLVVDSSEIPGPSIPGLSFIALIITGGYLLFRPWVRGPSTLSDRLKNLKHWTWTPSVVIRRTHRIASTLFLLLLAFILAFVAAGGAQSPALLIPPVVLLLYLAITGSYMFLRPWVNRFRTG